MRIPLAIFAAVAVHAGEPMLRNGGFEELDAAGMPAHWRNPNGVAVEAGDGSRVLRLKADKGGAGISQELVLDPAWSTLRFIYRAKVDAIVPGSENWHDARIALTFHGADGTVWHQVAGSWKEPTAGWTTVRQLVQVPAGATKVNVSPAIFNATGAWALDDLAVEVVAKRGEGIDAELPAGEALTWGQEPIEVQTSHRAEVCLNGLWRFQPANGPAAGTPLATGWGWLRVPGSWRDGPLPRVTRATGPAWEGFGGETPAGWYERDLAIPAAWAGRSVILDLRRVSTDAAVQIDGKDAGSVAWPGGEVDLTALVEPGRTHRLRVKVVAVADQAEVVRFMGMGEGQQLKEKVVLQTRGIVGDVLLTSRPRGATLTGCAIRTTMKAPGRGDSLGVVADYQGLAAAGELALTAVVRDAARNEVKRFTATIQAAAGAGSVQTSWPWEDPALWDIGSPNLYTLELAVRGAGIDDSLRENFGFREVRIDGRKILLNGIEVRTRPTPVHQESQMGGVRELIAAAFDGLQWAGFNTIEPWPWNRDERGTWEFDELWAAEADRRGLLVLMPAVDPAGQIASWAKPGVADAWDARMAPGIRRLRNHPSILMWVTGANRFGHGQDQNPEAIGQRARAEVQTPSYQRLLASSADIIGRIKRVDPSRGVFMHAGGAVGDLYTSNFYLCLTALQEREEWPSRWAKEGDMPIFMVEFGTPLYTTFHRGRRGYGQAATSEPLYSEFAAIYQGAEAYRLESPAYRAALAKTYDKGDLWNTWHVVDVPRLHEGFNRLQALFQRNTTRTWRTWGVNGILPWGNGHGWLSFKTNPVAIPTVKEEIEALAPFTPGLRGAWKADAPRNLTRFMRPEGMPMTVAGEVQVAASKETLAWIAGAPDFVDKTHHVRAGTTLAKQAALINDSRGAVDWSMEWKAELGGREFAAGAGAGRLAAAGIGFAPVDVAIPATLAAERVTGVIRLRCRVGTLRHEDTFPFTAFQPLMAKAQTKQARPVALLDPAGDTGALLRGLGIAAEAWNGSPTDRLVVVGRNAYARSGDPAALERHLAKGGRVLLMAQDPEWLRGKLGLRVARQLTRRAFPVIADHPALGGLKPEDLRDWAGSSRLVAANDTPFTDVDRTPPFGWRWGSRHALSSAAIELPHRAGWRPILACEFDGAYTTLAEAAVAGGMVVVCTLDLEDHAAADPAAERLARTLLAWATTAKPEQRSPAAYLGGDAGVAVLATSGIVCQRTAVLPESGCAILGADATTSDADLEAFLQRGGRLLVLPRQTADAPLGVKLTKVEAHSGSLTVPTWPSCRGLWPGELRRRSDGPAWTVDTGGDGIGADGLLAEVRRGSGVAVFCQLDTGLLDADKLAYNRLTRWRWTRVLTQLAGNLGIACVGDDRLVHPIPPPDRIALAGTWKAVPTRPLPEIGANDPKPKDAGPSPAALALVAAQADEKSMQDVAVPMAWENYGKTWQDGEGVFRRTVEIPAHWAGRDLVLSLGAVDDFDTAYFDGTAVGTTTIATPAFWTHARRYTIPGKLVTPGRHVIAVRVFDHFGGGGMVGSPEQMLLESKEPLNAPPASLYHADYKSDFPLGDDPYRYYRW